VGKRKYRKWEVILAKAVVEASKLADLPPEACKFCGSKIIVRYGTYKGIQRWICRTCGRKFADNKAPDGMRLPAIQIAAALSMFYEGLSLNAIRRNLKQTFNSFPSDSTVYNWIVKYTKLALADIREYTPSVGNIWVADETVLRIEGKNEWFWDIIDTSTRFLIASHMSETRTTRDARVFVERAARRAGKIPKVIVTDKLRAYIDGIKLAFGSETRHLPAKKLTAKEGTQLIERFHSTLKSRTKIMRGLKKRETARLILDGWLIRYNFLRPHESLHNLTPAEAAKIKVKFRNWLDIVKGG
jgi:putative transposase